MRKDKILARVLQGLAKLVSQEAARNLEFARQLDAITSELPTGSRQGSIPKSAAPLLDLPDIFGELRARGEAEFEL
jgi:hypothetical protein